MIDISQITAIDIQIIARFIVSHNGVLIYCSLLTLTAFTFFLVFRSKIRPIMKNIKAAITKLREMPSSDGFINGYKEFNDLVSTNPILKHNWAEYRKSFILPSPTEKKQNICNTVEAVCYFNEESIVAGRINLRFYFAFPNYLTGTGILGTFLGLVAGIYLASAGLASEDTLLLKKSLKDLLSGASLAFWTSIFGIVCSILFSWREKALTHDLFRSIDSWNRELDKRIEKITPEDLAQQQLKQMEQQTEYLEEFTTKVAFNIAEALDDRLNAKLIPTLNKLIDSVDTMRRDRGDTNEQLIQQMVNKFSESVQGAAGIEIKAIAGTLNALNETLLPLLQELKNAHSEMHDAALNIAEQVKTTYERTGKDFSAGVQVAIGELSSGISQAGDVLNSELKDAFDQAVDRLDTVVGKLDMSIGNIGDAGMNAEKMAIETRRLLDQFQSMAGNLSAIQLKMQGSLQALERTAVSIENAGIAARENIAQSARTLEELKAATKEFSSVQQDLKQVWSDYAIRFEDVDTALERIFIQINDGLGAYAEATTKYMGELDSQAQKVTQVFSGAVQEFGEAVEDLSETISAGRRP